MAKAPDAFRTISEVADWLDVPTHVLRFWESRFTQVKPVKRAGGRRYYRPADMELLGGIKRLLHDEGMTIRGVQKLLREEGIRHVSALSPSLDGPPAGEDRGKVITLTPKGVSTIDTAPDRWPFTDEAEEAVGKLNADYLDPADPPETAPAPDLSAVPDTGSSDANEDPEVPPSDRSTAPDASEESQGDAAQAPEDDWSEPDGPAPDPVSDHEPESNVLEGSDAPSAASPVDLQDSADDVGVPQTPSATEPASTPSIRDTASAGESGRADPSIPDEGEQVDLSQGPDLPQDHAAAARPAETPALDASPVPFEDIPLPDTDTLSLPYMPIALLAGMGRTGRARRARVLRPVAIEAEIVSRAWDARI